MHSMNNGPRGFSAFAVLSTKFGAAQDAHCGARRDSILIHKLDGCRDSFLRCNAKRRFHGHSFALKYASILIGHLKLSFLGRGWAGANSSWIFRVLV